MAMLFNRWIMIGLLIIGSALGMFWRELAESMTDGVSGFLSDDSNPVFLNDADIPKIKEVVFESEHNNIHQIVISDMKVLSHTKNDADISINLASRGKGNDYPHIRIFLLSSNGKTLRTIEQSPDEYQHGTTLTNEVVNLHFDLQPGEARFTLQALYIKPEVVK